MKDNKTYLLNEKNDTIYYITSLSLQADNAAARGDAIEATVQLRLAKTFVTVSIPVGTFLFVLIFLIWYIFKSP